MVKTTERRFRFQYSIGTLVLVTALAALLLVPVAWVQRERQEVLAAREAAVRAVVLAEREQAAVRLAVVAERSGAAVQQYDSRAERERTEAQRAAVLALRNRACLLQNGAAAQRRPDSGSSGPAAASTPLASKEQAPPARDSQSQQIVRLSLENAELKATIERLRREIERLKAPKALGERGGRPGQ